MSHGRIKLYIILFFSIRKRCQMRILLTVADVNRRLSLSSTRGYSTALCCPALLSVMACRFLYSGWPWGSAKIVPDETIPCSLCFEKLIHEVVDA
jgi:hypothetical protein